jgi:sec-independent protein translocase protein TatB
MGPSFADTIFLFLLALIIFGPKRLPEIGRQIGKVLNELKRASNEFKSQIQTEMDDLERQENAKKMLAPAQLPVGTIATLPLKPAPEIDASGVISEATSEATSSEVSSSDLVSSKADYPEDNSAEHKTHAVIDLKPIDVRSTDVQSTDVRSADAEIVPDPQAETPVKASNA